VAEQQKKYKLSAVLKSLAEEKRTGTLICIGEDNVQGRILFRQGRPISARCRNFQGNEAIKRINEHRLVSLRFHRHKNYVALEDETDMTDLSEDTVQQEEQVTSDDYKSLVDITSLTQLDDDEIMQAPLTTEIKVMIGEELTEYLGPVAEMFVADLQPGISLKDALNSLCRDIGDVDASIEFVNKVKERYRGY
jgi:hypothetical protein